MPLARKHQIDLQQTPYYHVYSRCVRRAFLCGKDRLTGRDFSHRRNLIRERLKLMAEVFCIEVCAFALMDNHLHLVLCVQEQAAAQLSDKEAMTRWNRIFEIPPMVQRYAHEPFGQKWIAERRERLADISWFMRCTKEWIARIANKEDDCKGRFWESRFHCNALTNEKALLTAMAYVDLNPIRASAAATPEESDHTSVQQRIRGAENADVRVPLKLFRDETPANQDLCLTKSQYVELVDATGRCLLAGKGHIDPNALAILDRIGHDSQSWLIAIRMLTTARYQVIGPADDLRRWAKSAGVKFLRGVRAYQRCY